MMPPNTPAAASQPGAASQPSTTVCIAAMPDGTFKVYAENEADETQEDAADQGSDDGQEESDEMAGAQTAPDIDTALNMARQMLGGQGGQQDESSADALFQGGFNKARGVPLNRA